MTARALIVASSVLVQVALARALFGTPLPARPGAAVLAFLLVTAAFIGIGFLIAALADNVPAVQAIGQSVFLPMILIGGVGVPLVTLPVWAQRVAGFMPGRYAVELLGPSFDSSLASSGAGFRFAALTAIGLAAGVAGANLFRWEAGRRSTQARWWVAAAMGTWVAVGAAAWSAGELRPILAAPPAWSEVTEAQIAEIRIDGLPADSGIVAGMAPAGLESAHGRDFASRLAVWKPGRLDDDGQSVRNLVSVAALADLSADQREAEIARLVFQRIREGFEPGVARQALAWVILAPEDGEVVRKAPELGLYRHPPERLVRQRCALFAQKYLGRLVGRIPD